MLLALFALCLFVLLLDTMHGMEDRSLVMMLFETAFLLALACLVGVLAKINGLILVIFLILVVSLGWGYRFYKQNKSTTFTL